MCFLPRFPEGCALALAPAIRFGMASKSEGCKQEEACGCKGDTLSHEEVGPAETKKAPSIPLHEKGQADCANAAGSNPTSGALKSSGPNPWSSEGLKPSEPNPTLWSSEGFQPSELKPDIWSSDGVRPSEFNPWSSEGLRP